MTYAMIDLQWFSAEDEGRTEEPSAFKLEKARKEGRVAKSQELNSSLVMLLTVIVLIFLGPAMFRNCTDILRFFFTRCTELHVDDPNIASAFFTFFLKLILPIGIVGIVGAIAGNIIQNRGFLFTTKPLGPNFKKILPNFGEYFKNTLFSFRGLFNIVKSIGKVVVIAVVAYALIRRDVPVLLLEIQNGNIGEATEYIAKMAAQLLVVAAVVFLIIAIPDYIVQRRQFMEEMKMTKQEVKEEYKEMEGDPEVKNHLQQEQRRLLQQNIPKAVKESDVVITNPTHFAVALKYDRTKDDRAPELTAKGSDETAFTIKRIARENNVPVVENRPLARGLYTDTNVGDIIPEQYIRAIVLVYTHIKYNSKK
jgi:flagellar biosynthesis protein FlhB